MKFLLKAKNVKIRITFLCGYQRKGFGFQIVCKCECHKKQVLGRVESQPNTIHLSSSGDAELCLIVIFLKINFSMRMLKL